LFHVIQDKLLFETYRNSAYTLHMEDTSTNLSHHRHVRW